MELSRDPDVRKAYARDASGLELVPDARYVYNVCLAYEAQQQWDRAIATCKQAKGMNADVDTVAKIEKIVYARKKAEQK